MRYIPIICRSLNIQHYYRCAGEESCVGILFSNLDAKCQLAMLGTQPLTKTLATSTLSIWKCEGIILFNHIENVLYAGK